MTLSESSRICSLVRTNFGNVETSRHRHKLSLIYLFHTGCCHGAFRCLLSASCSILHFMMKQIALPPPVSALLLHSCLTSPRLIYSAACTAYRSAGLFSGWAGSFFVCVCVSCDGVFVFGVGGGVYRTYLWHLHLPLTQQQSWSFDLCFYQSVTSCLHLRWIHQSTSSSPTLQPPCIHQREVRVTRRV